MLTRWRQLFGRTDRFALDVCLGTDGVRPELGAIAVYVDGVCVTRHDHPQVGHGELVSWDVLAIVGWIVDHWEAITTEGDLPHSSAGAATAAEWLARSSNPIRPLDESDEEAWFDARQRFWSRHSLAAADGVALPDVTIRRVLNDIEVAWTTEAGQRRPDIRWTERAGGARFPANEVAPVLARAAAAVFDQMPTHPEALRGDRLSRARQLRQAADAGRLLAPAPPFSLAASGGAALSTADRARLDDLVARARSDSAASLVPRPEPPRLQRPWESGFALAAAYRVEQGWGEDPLPPLAPHLQQLGVDVGPIEFDSVRLHGVSLVGTGYAPTVRWNVTSERASRSWGRESTLGHELCHLLFDWRPTDVWSILSGLASDWPTEARANAFAAALLLPPVGFQRALGSGRPIRPKAVRAAARRYGVSYQLAVNQLRNLELVQPDEADDLLAEMVPSDTARPA